MGEVLFICEGNTEVFLLFKILEKEFNIKIPQELKDNGNLNIKSVTGTIVPFGKNNDISINVTNLNGETKLNSYTKVLINDRSFNNLSKVLYIMDADYTQGNESGFERTKRAITDSISELKKNSENLICDYFITPNNKDEGMTETLLINALNCQEIVSYIKDDVIPTVKNMKECEITNEQKSTFMMIAATQNPLRATAPSFISKCYKKLNKENKDFKNLIDFIGNNIKL